jgi:hypothetical protein
MRFWFRKTEASANSVRIARHITASHSEPSNHLIEDIAAGSLTVPQTIQDALPKCVICVQICACCFASTQPKTHYRSHGPPIWWRMIVNCWLKSSRLHFVPVWLPSEFARTGSAAWPMWLRRSIGSGRAPSPPILMPRCRAPYKAWPEGKHQKSGLHHNRRGETGLPTFRGKVSF